MKPETIFGYLMAPETCSSMNRACSIGILIVLLFAAGCSGLGLLSLVLTSIALLSSTLTLVLSKQNSSEPARDRQAEGEGAKEEDCQGLADDSSVMGSLESSLSETECIDPTSTSEEDSSELDWALDRSDRTPDCSDDGSISDEESLIEIAIPSGHYIDDGYKEVPGNRKLFKRMPNFSINSILKGNSLILDLLGDLNEMNDEDNMIEIDISMGSIKCSRFGIEA